MSLPTAGAYPCQGRRTRRAAVPGQGAAAMRAERDAKELAVGHHDGKRSRSSINFSRPGGPLSMTRGYAELRALVQESSNTASRYTMVCVVLPHTFSGMLMPTSANRCHDREDMSSEWVECGYRILCTQRTYPHVRRVHRAFPPPGVSSYPVERAPATRGR